MKANADKSLMENQVFNITSDQNLCRFYVRLPGDKKD